MRRDCTLTIDKECKHSVRYKPVSSTEVVPVESIYVLRTALPKGEPPTTLKMTLEIPTRA